MVETAVLHFGGPCMRTSKIVCVILGFIALVAGSAVAAQGTTGRAFCNTRTSDSVVYVTPVFDDKLKAGSPYRSRLMGYEFVQFIEGRFDYPHSDPLAGQCASYASATQAESGRQTLELQVTQLKGRVVSVPWTYDPDSAEVELSFTAQRVQGGFGPEYNVPGIDQKGFCVSESHATPMYISAIFDFPSPVNLGQATIAWMKFLAAKHGYTGQGVNPGQQNPVHCGNGGWGDPARMVRARIAGAKASGRKIVETGWKFGMVDPTPNAAAATPSAPTPELREAAAKDGADALTVCQNDRMMNGAIDCYMLQRTVYNYRMANGIGVTLAELLANDKLDCTNCFNATNADMWATNRAQSNGYSLPKAKCVGPKFVAAFKAKPFYNRVKEHFEGAMKACPK